MRKPRDQPVYRRKSERSFRFELASRSGVFSDLGRFTELNIER